MGNVAQKSEKSISGAIKINEKEIVDHLSQLVRQSVRQILKIKQGSSTGVRYKSFSDKENAIPEAISKVFKNV